MISPVSPTLKLLTKWQMFTPVPPPAKSRNLVSQKKEIATKFQLKLKTGWSFYGVPFAPPCAILSLRPDLGWPELPSEGFGL